MKETNKRTNVSLWLKTGSIKLKSKEPNTVEMVLQTMWLSCKMYGYLFSDYPAVE